MGGNARPGLVERGEQDVEALAGLAEQIGPGHPASVERDRGGGRAAVPHLVLGADHLESGRSLLEDQCGDRRLVVADLRPFAEHQHELGDVAVGDENLAALDDDRVAVRGKPRLHAGGVGSGGRLGDGQRAEPSGGNAREQSLFLLRAADVDERLQSVESRGIDDAGRGAGLGNDFHHREVEPVGHPEPAIGRRHEDRVGADGVERADVVPRELTGAIDLGGVGGDDAVGHAPDLIEHQPLVLRPVPLALQRFEDFHGKPGPQRDRL